MKALITSLILGVTSASTLAMDYGFAVLPHYTFSDNNNSSTTLYLTNNSSQSLELEIYLHTDSGNLLTDDGNDLTGNIKSWDALSAVEATQPFGPSIKLSIKAYSTAKVKLKSSEDSSDYTGYGKLNWFARDVTGIRALVAHAKVTLNEGTSSENSYSVHIN